MLDPGEWWKKTKQWNSPTVVREHFSCYQSRHVRQMSIPEHQRQNVKPITGRTMTKHSNHPIFSEIRRASSQFRGGKPGIVSFVKIELLALPNGLEFKSLFILVSLIDPERHSNRRFSDQMRNQASYIALEKERIGTAPDFRNIWDGNLPMHDLSARGRNQKSGWLNRGFFRVKYLKQINVGEAFQMLSIVQTHFMKIRCEIMSFLWDEADFVT
jgi:hypothetical protein